VKATRTRTLEGLTPSGSRGAAVGLFLPADLIPHQHKARRKLANAKPHGCAGPNDIAKARPIAEAVKEVSQLDS